jgi:hypothetical protein
MEGRGLNYIGFRFTRNGAIHYGWFRLNVDSAGSMATIDAYGWENEPEMLVTIGDPGRIRVESIRVAGYSGVSGISTPGGTLLMEATITPENATNKRVRWSVSDTSLATIDTSGLLHARRNGLVTVTAESVENPGISGAAVITISGQPTSSVRVAPNDRVAGSVTLLPGGDALRIELASATSSPVTLMISDLTGRTLLTRTLNATSSIHQIDCSTLSNGAYLILCRVDGRSMTRRVVIGR